jgi:heme-degrading monooxygenase HmoA
MSTPGTGAWVLLFATAPEAPGAIADAYHEISRNLTGTPGLRRNALLELTSGQGRFVVLSEWESLDAFRAWEGGPVHRGLTAPLRQYHDRSFATAFEVYQTVAEYDGEKVPDGCTVS